MIRHYKIQVSYKSNANTGYRTSAIVGIATDKGIVRAAELAQQYIEAKGKGEIQVWSISYVGQVDVFELEPGEAK